MFTRLSTALMLAALGLAAAPAATTHDAQLAQCTPIIIPQLPTVPPQPPLLPPYQPSLIPVLPCPAPAPRPQIVQPPQPAQPAARAVAVTGDDGGCIPPHDKGQTPPPPHPITNC